MKPAEEKKVEIKRVNWKKKTTKLKNLKQILLQ